MSESNIEFDEYESAFDRAIESGLLSGSVKTADGKENALFAGNFMYMYSDQEADFFKNIMTRQYLRVTKRGV